MWKYIFSSFIDDLVLVNDPSRQFVKEVGWSLKPILDAMCAWGECHIDQSGEEVIS